MLKGGLFNKGGLFKKADLFKKGGNLSKKIPKNPPEKNYANE